MAPACIFWRF